MRTEKELNFMDINHSEDPYRNPNSDRKGYHMEYKLKTDIRNLDPRSEQKLSYQSHQNIPPSLQKLGYATNLGVSSAIKSSKLPISHFGKMTQSGSDRRSYLPTSSLNPLDLRSLNYAQINACDTGRSYNYDFSPPSNRYATKDSSYYLPNKEEFFSPKCYQELKDRLDLINKKLSHKDVNSSSSENSIRSNHKYVSTVSRSKSRQARSPGTRSSFQESNILSFLAKKVGNRSSKAQTSRMHKKTDSRTKTAFNSTYTRKKSAIDDKIACEAELLRTAFKLNQANNTIAKKNKRKFGPYSSHQEILGSSSGKYPVEG